MKNQFITLAVCLSLTATGAMAAQSNAFTVLPLNALSSSTGNSAILAECPASDVKPCPKKPLCGDFEAKMAKYRQDLYCKLGLSNAQKQQAETLHQKNQQELECLLAQFHTEKAKLCELKAKKASSCEIQAQKEKVKAAKKAIKDQRMKSRKDFESILNACQLAKFKQIKQERKAKAKCHCHHEHGHGE